MYRLREWWCQYDALNWESGYFFRIVSYIEHTRTQGDVISENDENPQHDVTSEDLEKDEDYKKVKDSKKVEDDNKVEDVAKFKIGSLDNVDHDTVDLAHD